MVNIKKAGGVLSKGFVATFAPRVLKGTLVEFFKQKNVDVDKITEWVLADKSLWDNLGTERQRQFKHLAGKIRDVSWLTDDWVIDSLRADFPAIASLFLGWKKSRNWLKRQIIIIQKELTS